MVEERMTYVLDGRRVAVRDLIGAGLLTVGQTLMFDRPRVGRRHTAVVEKGGTLLVDGRSYTTPSRAAATAAGMAAVDGWTAWVTEDGASLHRLRADLLELVAGAERAAADSDDAGHAAPADEEEIGSGDGVESLLPRHEFLKKAREASENGTPLVVPVRTLLGRWGVNVRDHRVGRHIEADLDNHGLVTQPSFLKVALDDEVALIPLPPVLSEPEPGDGDISGESRAAPRLVDGNQSEIGLTLGNLTSVAHRLVSLKPTATFAEAMTLMLMHDYSQLPMLVDDYTCDGVVTWKSMAYARLKDADAPLTAAVVPAVVRTYDQDLHSMLATLQEEQFVLVRDSSGKISNIITNADVVGLYGDRTLPFLLIGELDQELRRIMGSIPFEDVLAVCGKVGQKPKSYDDMTMYQYVTVLDDPDCWVRLGWPLDRQALVSQLHVLRRIRNDVMHFNPDGVPGGTVEKLRHMLALIREFGPATDG
ncbi:CBS domain-containing protein [Pseudonocardia sp. CA-107938]|uniref:restriction system modified-DNA reader domain-containing protein n=1 Tax=Pseudonocardia sp. CA-107938 TaxID=3240021 RepID=UPI003D90BBA3